MAYIDFLENISNKFNAKLEEISSNFNFDNGDEFEIAICKILRTLLPIKYGICRGFVVTIDGYKKGDDIIIYDQETYPLLRLLEDNTYAQKQNVPVEAVYAYLEAKHTLYLEGTGPQSLVKAYSQCCEVINLPREKVAPNQITPLIKIPKELGNFQRMANFPEHLNPIYGIIISRYVKIKEGQKKSSDKECYDQLRNLNITSKGLTNYPSIIIAGTDIVCFPASLEPSKEIAGVRSPFFIKDSNILFPLYSEKKSFSIGMTFLFWALYNIQLGPINWPNVLTKGLGMTNKDI